MLEHEFTEVLSFRDPDGPEDAPVYTFHVHAAGVTDEAACITAYLHFLTVLSVNDVDHPYDAMIRSRRFGSD